MNAPFRARAWRVALAVAAFGVVAAAQTPQRVLSVETIYHPSLRVDFNGAVGPDILWADADSYLSTRRTDGGVEWLRTAADSGRTVPLFDASRMEAALAALPGLSRRQTADAARSGSLILSQSKDAAIATIEGDLFYYAFASGRAARLTATADSDEEATFSPDGRLVAFVRLNNLFVVDVLSAREQALTTDGSAEILNGKLDWVYQEEVYGRGTFQSYWWSPDSSHLAFLQLNERAVPKYTLVDHLPYRPTLETDTYPKAGDPNPDVRLGIAPVTGGPPVWSSVTPGATSELLIVNVAWTPDSTQVVAQVQDREQTWLDLSLVDARTGAPQRIVRETTEAWVNENGSPVWLRDGTFLWVSERSGFRHIYHYRRDGTLIGPVTTGRWDVRTFYGIDQETNALYFAGAGHSAIGMDLYRVGLDGTGLTRLSRTDGWHRAIFNATFTRYVDVWSDVTTPPQARLHRTDGSEVRVLNANPVDSLAQYALVTPEFVQVPTRDGFVMEAMMIKPPDFNPSRRYPVYQFTYAGPGAQSVKNQWGGSQYLYHQLLAQNGVIVWILDNRSASGKGAVSQWPVYGRLGEVELQDLEDGVTWLAQQPYVDSTRLILHGWSYGGFMTAYALTHSSRWSAGIAGAPVTDWRDYDTIYTERLMRTPLNNPDGYRRTAPRFAAANLHGRMLLIHGTMDDNVHMQNSEQFSYELQKAGKSFEMMTYPRQRHGFSDPLLNTHLRQLMFDFVMRSASTAASSPTTAAR